MKYYVELASVRHRSRITDSFEELIGSRIESTKGKITARRLLRVVRTAGYAGSERSLRPRRPRREGRLPAPDRRRGPRL